MKFYMSSIKNEFQAILEYQGGVCILKVVSTVSKNVSQHFKSYKTVLARRELAGISDCNNTLTRDIEFKSSSVAGEFVSGRSCNGPSSWKTNDKVTLKTIFVEQSC